MTPVQRWEKRAEIPLLLLAVAFLVAYAWPVLDPRLSPDLRTSLEVASWTVWAAFIADFAARHGDTIDGPDPCFDARQHRSHRLIAARRIEAHPGYAGRTLGDAVAVRKRQAELGLDA